MSVGFFRLMNGIWGQGTILESNMAQTVGSASSSLASGVIFTIPALYLWGVDLPLFQLTMLAMLGGLLGILFMIPLRRFLIKEEHEKLPYPEGTACAEVLIASDSGGAKAGNVLLGLVVGLVFKFFVGFLKLWKSKVFFDLPLIQKAQLGIAATPAYMAVGYILGYRVSAIMVSGSLVSWLVLIPLMAFIGEHVNQPIWPETIKTISSMSPAEIWTRYIRYVGAGGVAFGGIITIVRSIPTMIKSFKLTTREIGKQFGSGKSSSETGTEKNILRTDKDLNLKYVFYGVFLIMLILAFVPGIIGMSTSLAIRLVAAPAIALFAFFFVTVSSRIVGLVGVSSNPTSGMTIVTLLGVSGIFVMLGWTDLIGKVTALTIGTVVCVASSIAGDTSQDLKTGFLVGATPYKQQIGELIGATTSAAAVCGAVIILAKTYQVGSVDLPAPQATLIKTIIDGVLETGIPWGLVLTGAFLGMIVELCSIPSLPFAVGLYLPVSSMTPIFFGGIIRYFIEKKHKDQPEELAKRKEKGILFSSGLIGGEGFLSVGVALYTFNFGKYIGLDLPISDNVSELISIILFAGVGFLLYKRTQTKD